MTKNSVASTTRPEAKQPMESLTAREAAAVIATQPTESADTSKKINLENLEKKIDACIDSNLELVKTIGKLITDLGISKKAGKF